MTYTGLMLLQSGGVGNLNPAASLGGAASQSKIAGAVSDQKVTNPTPIPGIYIAALWGNNLGSATIEFNFAGGTLSWTPSGQGIQSVTLGGDGVYKIGTTYGILFHLVSSELPGSNSSVAITVSQFVENSLDNAAYSDRQVGFTDYRCLYVKNLTGTVIATISLSTTQPTEGVISLANEWQDVYQQGIAGTDAEKFSIVDEDLTINVTAGFGVQPWVTDYYYEPGSYYGAPYEKTGVQDSDGVSSDLAAVIPNELDPSQIVSPMEWTSSLQWTNLGIGKYKSFWVKREYPPSAAGSLIHDSFLLTFTYTR